MKKYFLFPILVTLFFQCATRDEDPASRLNGFDPNGENWRNNANPTALVSIGKVWNNFDHADSTGEILLKVSATDPNLPVDTLTFKLFTGTSRNNLVNVYSGTSSSIILKKMKRNTSYICSLEVKDTWDSTGYYVEKIITPSSIPPQPPIPDAIASNTAITLTWNQVINAEKYYVYRKADPSDTFARIYSINQPASKTSTLTIFDSPLNYQMNQYLVSAVNSSGECKSKDTLSIRKYYTGISTPSINNVSKGTIKKYIDIYWSYSNYSSYSNFSHYEIYKSDSGNGKYTLLDTVSFRGSDSYHYYDSVKTMNTFYYRLVLVDYQGRGSAMSGYQYGYLATIPYPSMINSSSTENVIFLNWYSVSEAVSYNIYRSDSNCTYGFVKIATTKNLNYSDSVPTTKTYFYTITAVDNSGKESQKSSCTSASLTKIQAPVNVIASDKYSNRIIVTWSKSINAKGYVVYKSANPSDAFNPLDTVTDTTFIDSINNQSTNYYYYRIAAIGKNGVGYLSSYTLGLITFSPSLSIINDTTGAYLSWNSQSFAVRYYIYRSQDSTKFSLYDSTLSPYYKDTRSDFSPYYYYLVTRTATEMCAPGKISKGYRRLSPPAGFTLSDKNYGTRLSWNKKNGATGYVISKSMYSNQWLPYKSTLDTSFSDSILTSQRYYYAVAAYNTLDTGIYTLRIYGGIVGAPLTPQYTAVTGGAAFIQLEWVRNSSGSNPDKYYIYRSTSNISNPPLIDSTTSLIYKDSVPDGNTYYYWICAVNSAGISGKTTYTSSRRLAPGSIISATSSEYHLPQSVSLWWYRSTGADGYNIYRSISTSTSSFDKIGTTKDSTFADTTAVPGVNYYYRLSAYNPIGEIYYGSYLQGTRLAPPSGITITSTLYGVALSWAKPAYFSIPKYLIYRSTSPDGPFNKIDSAVSFSPNTNYTDTSFMTTQCYYKISSYDSGESGLSQAYGPAKRLYPDAPTQVTATKGTVSDAIIITWDPVAGATEYKVYRSSDSAFTSGITLVITTAKTAFTDSVNSGSVYYYKIKGLNSGGESSLSISMGEGFRMPSTAPLIPVDLTATTEFSAELRVTWALPATSVPVTGYEVYRSESVGGVYTLIGKTIELSYIDAPPLSFPTYYWYKIKAVNLKGSSGFSEAVKGGRR